MEHEQLDGWCERIVLGLVLLILGFTPLAFGGTPRNDELLFFFFVYCSYSMFTYFDSTFLIRTFSIQ